MSETTKKLGEALVDFLRAQKAADKWLRLQGWTLEDEK